MRSISASAEEREELGGAAVGRAFRVGEGGPFFEASAFVFWDWRATLTSVGLLAPWLRCVVAAAI